MANHGDHCIPLEDDHNDFSIRLPSKKNRSSIAYSNAGSRSKKNQSNRKKKDNPIEIFQLPLSDLLLNTEAGVFVTDDQDKLIWVNDAILEYPYFAAEIRVILGKPALQAVHFLQEFVVHPHQCVRRINELLSERKAFFGEDFPFKDGKVFRLDYTPCFHDGNFQGAIWQVTDNTKKASGTRDRGHDRDNTFEEMLDKFRIAYCEINMKGGIVSCSPFLCKFTGYPEKELLKINFIDLCHSGKQQIMKGIKSHRSGLMTKNSFSYELEILLRDGSTKWMQCHLSCKLAKDGSPTGGMLLLTEITEQKKIQQELEQAKKIAELAQVAQQQFLASMSHDIRTPLNAIIGMTFLMEDTPLDKEQNEYVKVLKNASNILLGLLNGVLDFAKIESGKQEIHQREFDLRGLLHSLVETFSFKLNEKPVRLSCNIDTGIDHILLGDDILLNQILMNLLSNAEKFTAKGEITLDAAVVKKYENNIWIEFKVEDTGIGISKEKLQEIFQDFIQADENIRLHYGGSGLGLFICKKLVEMLGGQISVESTPGRGTSFIFSLPFVLTDQLIKTSEAPIFSKQTFNTENIHVLVVEDNPMNLKYLSSLLRKYEISFDVATDGKYALKKAREQYYNLILMDMKLPKMSGMEVARYIREENTLNATTPIILVSAAAFQSTVDKAREVGVNELLAKPYAPDQLISILKKYLIDDDERDDLMELPASSEAAFRFDERLDIAYLQKLYSGNCSYAMSLFEVFIECMDADWKDIQQAIRTSNWLQLKNLVHKVKPNFSMVGLTWITATMQDIYDKLKQDDPEAAVPLLQEVQEGLEEYMPLVKGELQRMQQYLEQEVPS
jgi:PAS domain S-box-containing protein